MTPPILAQTNSTWDSSTANWTNAAHWSTNPIFPNNGQPNPGDTYNAIINGGTVTLDQNIVIQGLTLSGGTIDGGNNLTLNGATTWTNGAMSGAGTTTFNGSLALTTGGTGSRSLVNNGATTWSGGNLTSSGTWSNQSGALFDIQNNQSWDNVGVNNLAGATFRKSAGAGTSTIQGPFNNSGAVEANTGTLSFTGGGASSGSATFTVASGATLNFGSGSNVLYTVAAGSSISGAGGVSFNFDTIINGTWSNTGLVTVSRGAATFNVPATFGSLLVNGGTLTGSGNLIVSGATTWSDGSMSGAGTTTFNGSVSLTGGSNLNLSRPAVNNATTTWSGPNNLIGSGTWSNQSGALVDIQNNQNWGVSFNNLAGATVRKSAGAGTTTFQGAFNNSGAVEANTGTLSFTGGGSSSGSATFTAASGATLNFGSGANVAYTVAAGSTISGAGGVSFNFDTTINGTWSNTGLVTVSRGAATFNVPATFGSLRVDGGTLNGSGNIIVSGQTTWLDGSISGAGTMTFNGPTALTGGSNLNLSRPAVNNATTTWSGPNNLIGSGTWSNQSGALFDIQNDQNWAVSFSNLAGATFRKSAGVGTTAMQAAFNNAGTIQAQSGTIAFNGGFTQTAGTTTLAGGSITSNSIMNFNGGSLTGSGTVGAAAAFTNATIAPGASAGTLTFGGNLSLDAGTVLDFELGTASDLINVNGNLILDGTLNVAALPGFGQGTFVILDYSGSLTDNGLTLGSAPGGFDYQIFNDAVLTQIRLLVSVPEPATIWLVGATLIAATVAGAYRRRSPAK